ncbi:MFS transporter [Lacticaseibacillus pabuli]|uniref:MFS transporter n=2 Tax=Lacticaseibacillus pabuli TaxID=3025672 RepID=A0ABY7WVX4_9LACO|nr:MFS transporter [Lacticaseibacillus sp. KACC 23028]WDF83300.1 MFS transporter [Lacticaseibacillus sp. KACC 23028]
MATKHHEYQTVMVLGLISLLTSLSGSSLTLALPQLSRDFDISNSTATWAVTVGLVTSTILLVMFGHIGDLLSKRSVFFAGGLVFVFGSLFAGIAPTFILLLLGRVVQAVGIAMTMANGMGIISDNFPSATRAEALAIVSMFTSVGAISGPAVGGLLISLLSWRWIYLINVPLGVVILLVGWRVLKPTIPQRATVKQIWSGANWTGQNLFTFGIIAFFVGGALISQPRWQLLAWVGLIAGAALTVASFIQDDRSKSPWIDPQLLRNPDYMISVATLLIVMLVNAISNILLPFYLQSFLGIQPFASGLLMMGQSATMLLITPIAGYLADHWNRYWLTVLGLIILIVSQAGYALYPATNNMFLILWPIVLNGVGLGLFLSPNNALTMDTVPQKLGGVAGSLNSFARTLGMTFGMTFGAILMFIQLPGVNRITPATTGFLSAFANVFWGSAALSVLGLVVVLVRVVRLRRSKSKAN